MVGWLVFGALGAALAAELYVMYKREEEANKDECKCGCCCCHEEEEEHECCGCCQEEEIEVVDSLECKCNCCCEENKENEVDVEE